MSQFPVFWLYSAVFSISCCIAFLNDDIILSSYTIRAKPGDNVTLFCNFTDDYNTTEIVWTINNEIAKSVEVINDHSVMLKLIGVGVQRKFRQSTNLVCRSWDWRGAAGATLYTGFPPLAPQIECLLEGYTKLHCRWRGQFDSRTDGHPEWIPPTTYKANYTSFWQQHQNDSCKVTGTSCVCLNSKGWFYAHNVSFAVYVNNKLGINSSTDSIKVDDNVMLSPIQLHWNNVNVSIPDEGSSIEVFLIQDFGKWEQYCRVFLEIEFKQISHDMDLKLLESRVETYNHNTNEKFWKDWSSFEEKKDDEFYLDRPQNWLRREEREIFEHESLFFHHLPSNVPLLLSARWKLNGSRERNELLRCGGPWSVHSLTVARTSIIPPPSITEFALLYFNEKESGSCNIGSNNATGILQWKHNASVMFYHKHNVYGYNVRLENCGPLRSMNITEETKFVLTTKLSPSCRLRVGSFSNGIQSFSPWVRPSENVGGDCHVDILEVDVSINKSGSLNLQILYKDERKSQCLGMRMALFFLEENCTKCEYPRSKNMQHKGNYSQWKVKRINVEVKQKEEEHQPSVLFDVVKMKETVTVYHGFQQYTAYRVAASTFLPVGKEIEQGPASLSESVVYHQIQKPSAPPCEVDVSEATSSSLTVLWNVVEPGQRHGPINGYRVYYTRNKKCLVTEYGLVNCLKPSEKCKKEDISVLNYTIGSHVTVDASQSNRSQNSSGWFVERDVSSQYQVSLEDLSPDTSYYIGVSAYNQAGESGCLRQSLGKTHKESHWELWFIPTLVVPMVVIATIFLYRCRGAIKRFYRIPLPHPTLKISISRDSDVRMSELARRGEDETNEKVDEMDFPLIQLCDENCEGSGRTNRTGTVEQTSFETNNNVISRVWQSTPRRISSFPELHGSLLAGESQYCNSSTRRDYEKVEWKSASGENFKESAPLYVSSKVADGSNYSISNIGSVYLSPEKALLMSMRQNNRHTQGNSK